MKRALLALALAATAVHAEAPDAIHAADAAKVTVGLPSAESWLTWHKPTAGEMLLMGAAGAMIVVDVWQTLDLKHHSDVSENNLLLGRHPSDLRLVLMGTGGLMLATTAWYVAPPTIRWVVPVVLIVAEATVIYSNHQAGMRLTF